ncbi:hypothetical protein [Streptomyces sp. NPDC093097]|uniref:hypothetical protein n=1 Tax=Streptomyces sp. NPDC093097 TaxID=3366027 RepID=UPI0038080665
MTTSNTADRPHRAHFQLRFPDVPLGSPVGVGAEAGARTLVGPAGAALGRGAAAAR